MYLEMSILSYVVANLEKRFPAGKNFNYEYVKLSIYSNCLLPLI